MNISITPSDIFMVLGFSLSLYSCVSNDVIQTLGTFLSSTKDKPVWLIWLFASTVLVVTLFSGWYLSGGTDMAFGRLDRIPPLDRLYWWHIIPPLALIYMTKKGLPVATAFIILTVFSPSTVIGLMVMKSLVGYFSAFACAFVIYFFISRKIEKHFLYSKGERIPTGWIVAKWISTVFLWSSWLMQDAAVLYVYLPRQLNLWQVLVSLAAACGLLYIICYKRGGEIQNILKLKTNTQDTRSATIIDIVFASILFFFQHVNNIPMSTTWVFLGVLAGREIAMYNRIRFETEKKVYKHIFKDFSKASMGLVLSIVVAMVVTHIPIIENYIRNFFN